jgi:serine/threonine protein kinase
MSSPRNRSRSLNYLAELNLFSDSVFREKYNFLDDLAAGSFGKVIKCMNKSTGEEVAVKLIDKRTLNPSLFTEVAQEAEILAKLDHPHIVKLKDVHHSDSFMMIEMELLNGGTLQDLLNTRSLTDSEAAEIIRCVLEGVKYLHNKDIVHRDLKPENIMFQHPDDFQSLKITDFGLSAQCKHDLDFLERHCGTVIYMAPEQARNRNYSKPVDIWSIAMIMHMLLTGKHPLYEPADTTEVYFKKLENFKWQNDEKLPRLARHLFVKITKMAPVERYSAEQALQHPWVTRLESSPKPMTFLDKLRKLNCESKLKKLSMTVFILAALQKDIRPNSIYKGMILNRDLSLTWDMLEPKSDNTPEYIIPSMPEIKFRVAKRPDERIKLRRGSTFVKTIEPGSPLLGRAPVRSAQRRNSLKPF